MPLSLRGVRRLVLLSNLVLCFPLALYPQTPHPTHPGCIFIAWAQHTLLRQKQSIALLNRNPVPAVLVVGRETGRVRALADFAVDDLFQRVDALGRVRRVGDVHEMHARFGVSFALL